MVRRLEGSIEAGFIERLQQVVECTRIECFERILIVGGHKDDRGRRLGAEHF
jgi:hypothetical protein